MVPLHHDWPPSNAPLEWRTLTASGSYVCDETNRSVQMPTYLFPPRDSALRSEPLGAKIYAKKAACAGFARFGGEPLASLADVGDVYLCRLH